MYLNNLSVLSVRFVATRDDSASSGVCQVRLCEPLAESDFSTEQRIAGALEDADKGAGESLTPPLTACFWLIVLWFDGT